MTDALAAHKGNVSIGGIIIVSMRFAEVIAGIIRENVEFKGLVDRLDTYTKA